MMPWGLDRNGMQLWSCGYQLSVGSLTCVTPSNLSKDMAVKVCVSALSPYSRYIVMCWQCWFVKIISLLPYNAHLSPSQATWNAHWFGLECTWHPCVLQLDQHGRLKGFFAAHLDCWYTWLQRPALDRSNEYSWLSRHSFACTKGKKAGTAGT